MPALCAEAPRARVLVWIALVGLVGAAAPALAQSFTCGEQHLGTDDGCDCGCGVSDPDCGAAPVNVRACEYDGCADGEVPSATDAAACVPNVCGDGYVGDSEACDDGDALTGGGCTAGCDAIDAGWLCGVRAEGCRRERCGDGQRTRTERCDDGNQAAGDGCAPDCTGEPGFICFDGFPCRMTFCGDLYAEYDFTTRTGETCDDGNQIAGDGCFNCEVEPGYYCDPFGSFCQQTVCGDGLVQGDPYYGLGETCDDQNDDPNDGCDDCVAAPGAICWNGPCHFAECGDGIIDYDGITGFEQCDDGDSESNDGCSATCTMEPGFDCFSVPPGSPCIEVRCGDGVVSYDQLGISEMCDDGNEESGDGCDTSCTIEGGFLCETPGEPCRRPVCGDGFADRDPIWGTVLEECDDGNGNDGDGCSRDCVVEDGFECLSEGRPCIELPPGWSCSGAFWGTGDGCDCGCGSPDPDCPSEAVSACAFNHCFDEPLVAPDPCEPWRCVREDEADDAQCPLDDVDVDGDGDGDADDGVALIGCGALAPSAGLEGAMALVMVWLARAADRRYRANRPSMICWTKRRRR